MNSDGTQAGRCTGLTRRRANLSAANPLRSRVFDPRTMSDQDHVPILQLEQDDGNRQYTATSSAGISASNSARTTRSSTTPKPAARGSRWSSATSPCCPRASRRPGLPCTTPKSSRAVPRAKLAGVVQDPHVMRLVSEMGTKVAGAKKHLSSYEAKVDKLYAETVRFEAL